MSVNVRPILLLALLILVQSGAARAQGEIQTATDIAAECTADLQEPIVYPPNWRLVPKQIEALLAARPQLNEQVRNAIHLANFLNEENEEFFEYFGARTNYGHSRSSLAKFLLPGFSEGEANRFWTTMTILDSAARRGLIPSYLNNIWTTAVFAFALGELKVSDDLPFDQAFFDGLANLSDLKQIVECHRLSLNDVIVHSRAAQSGLLSTCPSVEFIDWENAGEAFRQELTDGTQSQDPGLRHLVDEARAVLRGDYPEKREAAAKGISGAPLRKFVASTERRYLAQFLYAFMYVASEDLREIYVNTPIADIRDPVAVVHSLAQIVETDMFIDRKLQPFYFGLLARKVFGVAPVAGAEVSAKIRRALQDDFASFRRKSMEVTAATSPSPSPAQKVALLLPPAEPTRLPTRAERLNDYVRTALRSEAKKMTTAERGRSRADGSAAPPEPALDAAFWDNLLDPLQPLAEAQRRLVESLQPNQTYVLSILSTGFRYRIQLSPRLIKHFLHPRENEPGDFREWLEVLRLGAARSRGERGWKKLIPVVDGRFEWEIRTLTSPYRILGLKTADGIWRFDTIRLTN